jgi:hypothetical protein
MVSLHIVLYLHDTQVGANVVRKIKQNAFKNIDMTATARQRRGKHVSATMKKEATEEPLGEISLMRSVLRRVAGFGMSGVGETQCLGM